MRQRGASLWRPKERWVCTGSPVVPNGPAGERVNEQPKCRRHTAARASAQRPNAQAGHATAWHTHTHSVPLVDLVHSAQLPGSGAHLSYMARQIEKTANINRNLIKSHSAAREREREKTPEGHIMTTAGTGQRELAAAMTYLKSCAPSESCQWRASK